MIHKKESIFLLQKLTISIVLVLCFASSTLQASDEEKGFVLEFYPKWYSQEDYTVQGNIGIEKAFQSNDWVKYYTKPSFTYALDYNWALHGGLGFYYTDYQESDNNFEIRPFQGISHFHPLTEAWQLSSYFRVEERFQYDTSTWDKDDSVRLRLRFRTAYTLNPLSREHSWHKLIFGIEGFKSYNTDQDADDYESQVTFGAERTLNEQNIVRFELEWKYESPPNRISDTPINTVYFKIQYYPVWGNTLRNELFHRGIDD